MEKQWYVGSQNDGLCIIDRKPSPSGTDVVWKGHSDLKHIACVDLVDHDFKEGQANAVLLAAAPELLRACKVALDAFGPDRTPSERRAAERLIHEAVKKAEGR